MPTRSLDLLLTLLATVVSLGCSADPSFGGSATGALTRRVPGNSTGATSSSTGTTGGGGAPDAGSTGSSCPAGQAQLLSKTIDLCTSLQNQNPTAPAVGVSVDTIPSFGPPVLSGVNGNFQVCVPEGQNFVTSFTLKGDEPLELEAQNLGGDQKFLSTHGGITMICSQLLSGLQQKLSADPQKSAVLVAVTSLSDNVSCSRSGWGFTAQAADGGPPGSPWPVAFLDNSANISFSGGTTDSGLALVYNIDPGVEWVTVAPVNLAATAQCTPLPNTGFTGVVPVSARFLAFFPILVP